MDSFAERLRLAHVWAQLVCNNVMTSLQPCLTRRWMHVQPLRCWWETS